MRLVILLVAAGTLNAFFPDRVSAMSDGLATFILISCIIQDWMEVWKK